MDFCKICFFGGVKFEGYGDDYEMVNMEFMCDYCQGLIIGWRMNCNVCDDFDFCYGCYIVKKYFYGYLLIYSIIAYLMVIICISDWQLVGDCLMKVYQGKGFKVLVFFGVLLDGDFILEN